MARPEKWTTPLPPPPPRPPREDQRSPNDGQHNNDAPSSVIVQPSLLHPRVAVVLGVSEGWHPPLFACRLLSTGPAVWWGFPMAVRLLVHLYLLVAAGVGDGRLLSDGGWFRADGNLFDRQLRLMETVLALIWVRYRRIEPRS